MLEPVPSSDLRVQQLQRQLLLGRRGGGLSSHRQGPGEGAVGHQWPRVELEAGATPVSAKRGPACSGASPC